jgi:hypothetical protein
MNHVYTCSYLNIHDALYITWQVYLDNCLIMSKKLAYMSNVSRFHTSSSSSFM